MNNISNEHLREKIELEPVNNMFIYVNTLGLH